jgi:hypothetical protein
MLKPNYHWKEIRKNYKIYHYCGNDFFGVQKTKGIHEIVANGYEIRFIPKYDVDKYDFPPTINEFEKIAGRPRNMQEARVYLFSYSIIVFFEYPEKAGQNFIFYSDDNLSDNEKKSNFGLIHCIGSVTFKTLTKEMQRKMPYILSERNLTHHIRHDDIADLKFVQFLDTKFQKLKDLLPPNFRESLEL